jgi:hypothetical protein
VPIPALDSKDQFSKPVTRLNSATMRSGWVGPGQLISFLQVMVYIGSVCVTLEGASAMVLVPTVSDETLVEV